MIYSRTKLGAIDAHAPMRTGGASINPLCVSAPAAPPYPRLTAPSVSSSYRIPFKIGQPKKQIVSKTVSNAVLVP